MRKPKIGIALGSGGARGWSHIGVLRALQDEGIEPDIVAGCSMGSLVGAAYVAGELDFIEDWAKKVTWKTILGFLDVNLSGGGLIEGAHIEQFINRISEDLQIENLKKPFIAIASDLSTGREVWLQKGALLDAVRASTAIPGIFGPKNIDGQWLLDGGMTNPVPVSACRAMGADIIIAVDPNANLLQTYVPFADSGQPENDPVEDEGTLFSMLGKEGAIASVSGKIREGVMSFTPDIFGLRSEAPGYFDVLSKSIDIMTDQIKRNRLASDPPHVLINQQLEDISSLEFHRAEEAIDRGRESVLTAMPLLRRYLGES